MFSIPSDYRRLDTIMLRPLDAIRGFEALKVALESSLSDSPPLFDPSRFLLLLVSTYMLTTKIPETELVRGPFEKSGKALEWNPVLCSKITHQNFAKDAFALGKLLDMAKIREICMVSEGVEAKPLICKARPFENWFCRFFKGSGISKARVSEGSMNLRDSSL